MQLRLNRPRNGLQGPALLAAGLLFLLPCVTALDNSVDANSQCDIQPALTPRLSPNARIVLHNNSAFSTFELRSSAPRISPKYNAVVEVATEKDVQETISFANACNISFLAISGAHGWPASMNNAQNTIQISLRKFQEVEVINDGQSARVGGGVLQRTLVHQLYAQGKQTVTGLAECVSVTGPLLGGGHSLLQGQYGFASDQLRSARVVLADGQAVNVSADENEDLFWALRGAGHNFGVVTNFEVEIYNVPASKWTVATLTYTQDRLEEFIDALNDVDNNGDHAPGLALFGMIARIDAVDPQNPVIAYQVAYLGTKDEAAPYIKRFQAANPVSTTTEEHIEYKDLSVAVHNGANDTACIKQHNLVGYGVSLPNYNKTAMREAFKYYSEVTADPRFNGSGWLLESYGSRGVRAKDYSASAIPAAERDLAVLTAPIFLWPGDDVSAQAKANEYGQKMRRVLAEGASHPFNQTHVYLNYAKGGETLEQMYGGNETLPRLKALKAKYDPHNRFAFYLPLV